MTKIANALKAALAVTAIVAGTVLATTTAIMLACGAEPF